MKIAICISGFTRQYLECYPSYKKYILDSLQHHDVDVFFHGWSNNNDEQIKELYQTKCCVTKLHTNETMQEIKDAVDVGYISDLDQTIATNRLKSNMTGMFYNIYKCNELRKQYALEQNITYDITIHTRPDNVFFKPLQLQNVENTIWFGGCQSTICDHFFYGSPKNMNIIAGIYLKLKELFETKIRGVGAEHMLHHVIYENNINIKKETCLQHAVYYMAIKKYKKMMII